MSRDVWTLPTGLVGGRGDGELLWRLEYAYRTLEAAMRGRERGVESLLIRRESEDALVKLEDAPLFRVVYRFGDVADHRRYEAHSLRASFLRVWRVPHELVRARDLRWLQSRGFEPRVRDVCLPQKHDGRGAWRVVEPSDVRKLVVSCRELAEHVGFLTPVA